MAHAVRTLPSITSHAPVDFTGAARETIAAACRREGPQVIIVSWPAGAAYLPATCYSPTEDDVMLGRVAGCPVYADRRRLALFPTHRMLLDAEPISPHRLRPPLRLRATTS